MIASDSTGGLTINLSIHFDDQLSKPYIDH